MSVTCPQCGGTDVVPVAYGMPGPETIEASRRGEVVIGGCVLTVGPDGEPDMNDSVCRTCETWFARPRRRRRVVAPPAVPSPDPPAPEARPARPTTQRRKISLRPETYGQVIEPKGPKRAGPVRIRPRPEQAGG